jgi:hypothetical protein
MTALGLYRTLQKEIRERWIARLSTGNETPLAEVIGPNPSIPIYRHTDMLVPIESPWNR